MSATRAAEARAEANPENERDPPAPQEESIDRQDEKEKLYAEVLYTIANTVGAPAPGGQVNQYRWAESYDFGTLLGGNLCK